MDIRIKTKSVEDRKTCLGVIMALGCSVHPKTDNYTDPQIVEKLYSFEDYNNVMVRHNYLGDNNFLTVSSSNVYDYEWPEEAATIFKVVLEGLSDVIIEIQGVGDYTALISRENIKVGCQTISHEKFQELVEAVNKVKN